MYSTVLIMLFKLIEFLKAKKNVLGFFNSLNKRWTF